MNDNKDFLVRILTQKKDEKYPTIICSCTSNDIDKYLKLYITAKRQEVPLVFESFFRDIRQEFLHKQGYVKEIVIEPGTNKIYTSLNIYVDVI